MKGASSFADQLLSFVNDPKNPQATRDFDELLESIMRLSKQKDLRELQGMSNGI